MSLFWRRTRKHTPSIIKEKTPREEAQDVLIDAVAMMVRCTGLTTTEKLVKQAGIFLEMEIAKRKREAVEGKG